MQSTRTIVTTLLTWTFYGLLLTGLSACTTEATNVHSAVEESHEGHAARHGGMVESAGSGHMELVFSDGRLFIYPFDADEQPHPVDDITEATATIQANGAAEQTISLSQMGDHLMGTLPGEIHHFTAHVTMPTEGKTWSANFRVGMDEDSEHDN